MKQIAIISFALFISATIYSQRLFVHVAGGIMNYGGDLQSKSFTLSQAKAAFGIGLSYKLSGHFSVTGSYISGKIQASDTLNHAQTYERNLSFHSNISEGNLLFEASLKEVPGIAKFTPYLFGGVAIFHFNPYTFDTAGNKVYLQPLGTEGQGLPEYPNREMYKLTQFAIPFGVGIKYAISDKVVLGTEICFRKLFTDHLDDVSTNYPDTALLRSARGPLAVELSYRGDEITPPVAFNNKVPRGNPDRKDVYYTCLLKLSFSLGNNGRSNNPYLKKMRRQTGCPSKAKVL